MLWRGSGHRSLNTYVEHTAEVRPGSSGGPLLAFPLEAVLRAERGEGWSLEEGEEWGVLGVTVAKSVEHEFTTYTIFSHDARSFVDSAWGDLGLKLSDPPSLSDDFSVYTASW